VPPAERDAEPGREGATRVRVGSPHEFDIGKEKIATSQTDRHAGAEPPVVVADQSIVFAEEFRCRDLTPGNTVRARRRHTGTQAAVSNLARDRSLDRQAVRKPQYHFS